LANSLNQYSLYGGTPSPCTGGVTPTYDGNGNLASDGTFSYCYDTESRLTSVLRAGTCASPTTTVASYAYDAQGRRKSKTVGGVTTIFVTDANNREVLEYNGSGVTQNWYAYGQGSNEVLNRMNVAAGTRQTLTPDIQGSIIGMLDSGTGALTKVGYQSYGENPSLTSGTFNYTAQRFDAETATSGSQPSGLYYYRARMYSPTWGRFLQPDPIGFAGGGNLYAYVGNDPLNAIDPSGLAADGPQNSQGNYWGVPQAGVATIGAVDTAGTGIAGGATAGVGAGTIVTLGVFGAAAVGLAGDTLQKSDPFYNATYTRTNPVTGQVYSGRTSGYGSPSELVRLRGLQQNILNAQGFAPPQLDVAATGGIPAYSAIRGREQQLINFHGGAQSIGGTSRNMINGISPINPLGPIYIQSSVAAFGALPNNSPTGRNGQ